MSDYKIISKTEDAFRSALMDTVKPLEEKYGVKIEMGNITYVLDALAKSKQEEKENE